MSHCLNCLRQLADRGEPETPRRAKRGVDRPDLCWDCSWQLMSDGLISIPPPRDGFGLALQDTYKRMGLT